MTTLRESARSYTTATFSSLRVRNYRLYYVGQIISTSGTFMQSIAQDWLVLKLSNSGLALGAVTALQYLPILLFGPYGGLVADRFSKRKIIYATQATAGVLALVMGLLVVFGWAQLWMVFVLAFGLGVVTVFDMPARQTFVMELVGEKDLKNAVTLYSTLVNLSRIIGPAVAGIIIASLGLALCFILNGLSYIAVIVMLAMVNPAELHMAPAAQRAKGQLRAGWNYVLSKPVLSTTLLLMAIIGTLTYEFQVTLPLMARYALLGDADVYALLTASLGAGAVIGGLLIAGRGKATPSQMMKGAFLFGLATIASAFMPGQWLTAAALVLVGMCSIAFSSLGNTLLQLESDPQMRGRVMSFWSIAVLGSSTIGGPIVGWVGQEFGARWGLALGGVAAVVAAGVGARMLRSAARPAPIDAAAGREASQAGD